MGGGEKTGKLPRIRGGLVLIPLGGSSGTLVSHPSPDCGLVMDKPRQEDAQPPRACACTRPQTELTAPPPLLSFIAASGRDRLWNAQHKWDPAASPQKPITGIETRTMQELDSPCGIVSCHGASW